MSDGHLSNVTRRGNISQRVQCLSASGIRRFFDILDAWTTSSRWASASRTS